jgi:hypothetical protein
MTSSIDHLLEESVSECVAYTEFMLHYRKEDDILYCFFEGHEDRTYYSIRIKNISRANSYTDFVCGGKDQVLKVHGLIKSNKHYSSAKTSFFVDSDFDNGTYSSDIYVTPTYSIENLYCLQKSFENILVSEFKMSLGDTDFTKCVTSFLNLQKKFNEEILLFNAWLACQADYRNTHRTSTRLNIDKKTKVIFDKVVLPDLSSVKSFTEVQSKTAIESIFTDSPVISQEALDKKCFEFKSVQHIERFRGRFQIRFLESFLCRLQSISGLSCNPFNKKYSCSLHFEHATICSALSQYAETTSCLKKYVLHVSQ